MYQHLNQLINAARELVRDIHLCHLALTGLNMLTYNVHRVLTEREANFNRIHPLPYPLCMLLSWRTSISTRGFTAMSNTHFHAILPGLEASPVGW